MPPHLGAHIGPDAALEWRALGRLGTSGTSSTIDPGGVFGLFGGVGVGVGGGIGLGLHRRGRDRGVGRSSQLGPRGTTP